MKGLQLGIQYMMFSQTQLRNHCEIQQKLTVTETNTTEKLKSFHKRQVYTALSKSHILF
jgi:hypothetical protein